MINNKEFGIRLRKARKERGFSQAELASTIQISIQSLSYYENGKVLPAVDYLHDIAAVLNVSVDYLLFGDEYAKQLINDERIVDYKTFVNKTLNLIDTNLINLKIQEGPFLPKAILLQIDDPLLFTIYNDIKKYVDEKDKLNSSTYRLLINNILDSYNKEINQ